jgi:hypothetical protein
MKYRNWYNKDVCDNDEKDPGKMVMGTTTTAAGVKLCVFWAWQLPANPMENQQWLGPSTGTGNTILFKHACTGNPTVCSKCLDLTNGNATNGNKIEIWDCNGAKNQQW